VREKSSRSRVAEITLSTGSAKDQWRTSQPYVEMQVEVRSLDEVLKKHPAPEIIVCLAMDV